MELSKNIIAVIDEICSNFGIAIDWSKDNVVPYLKELMDKLVNYEIYTSWMWLIVGLLICLIYISFIYKKDYRDVNTIIFGIFSIIPIVIIGFQIHDLIGLYVFPEKCVFEYIQNIIQNS